MLLFCLLLVRLINSFDIRHFSLSLRSVKTKKNPQQQSVDMAIISRIFSLIKTSYTQHTLYLNAFHVVLRISIFFLLSSNLITRWRFIYFKKRRNKNLKFVSRLLLLLMHVCMQNYFRWFVFHNAFLNETCKTTINWL